MTHLTNWKVAVAVLTVGSLLLFGATNLNQPDDEIASCNEDQKVFQINVAPFGAAHVKELRMRISPYVDLSHLRIEPYPQLIVEDQPGLYEIQFSMNQLLGRDQIRVSVCDATELHEIREARLILEHDGLLIAQIVEADDVTWEMIQGGELVVSNTQLMTKEITCTGDPLVAVGDSVEIGNPLCIRDPEKLEQLTAEIEVVTRKQDSFLGRFQVLILGTEKFEDELAKLETEMQKVFFYTPYKGVIQNIIKDTMNDVIRIVLEVEEVMGH